jgi:hypothetical protein
MDRYRDTDRRGALRERRRPRDPPALGEGREIHAYLDTQKVRAACDRMARADVPEADAAPIEA